MADSLSSQAPAPPPPCKICKGQTENFFTCDFHNQAKINYGLYSADAQPVGVTLDYVRCGTCGFVFSTFMDPWSAQQFATFVYNKDYARLDGGYNGQRAGAMANILYLGLQDSLKSLSILDYGGGLGIQTSLLRTFGCPNAQNYDPFVQGTKKPEGRFNIVTAMEVLEHSTDPIQTANNLADFTDLHNGFVLITTEMQPPDMLQQGKDWWYVAPRVGHVSLYTKDALVRLFQPHGMKFLHIADNIHLGFRTWPIWAEQLMPAHMMGA